MGPMSPSVCVGWDSAAQPQALATILHKNSFPRVDAGDMMPESPLSY